MTQSGSAARCLCASKLEEHVALSIRSAQLAKKSGYAVGAWRNTTCGAVLLFGRCSLFSRDRDQVLRPSLECRRARMAHNQTTERNLRVTQLTSMSTSVRLLMTLE